MTEIKKNMEEANLKIEFVKKKMEERKTMHKNKRRKPDDIFIT